MTGRVHSRLRLLDEANSIQKDERSLPVLGGPTNILDSILAAIALGLTLGFIIGSIHTFGPWIAFKIGSLSEPWLRAIGIALTILGLLIAALPSLLP